MLVVLRLLLKVLGFGVVTNYDLIMILNMLLKSVMIENIGHSSLIDQCRPIQNLGRLILYEHW